MTEPYPATSSPPLETSPQSLGSSTGACPVCRVEATSDFIECPSCHIRHHKDCWEYNRGCGAYGCTAAPPTEKLTDIEIPASFWGRSEKNCPVCNSVIQAAALRCRFCNTVFSSARPQDAGEFHQQRAVSDELPKLRKQSIILLIFCVIPFTAPLAAIIGWIWYVAHRRSLAALPASLAALPKIALGVAVVQTLILIAVLIINALTGSSAGLSP
jgi:hypothetical protein